MKSWTHWQNREAQFGGIEKQTVLDIQIDVAEHIRNEVEQMRAWESGINTRDDIVRELDRIIRDLRLQ